ncbi:MAG: hypothetical protein RJQ04_12430 [Longimicrobiales bacterium]
MKTGLLRLLRIGAATWVGLALLLVLAETRLVYAGAGSAGDALPHPSSGLPWDTVRVAPTSGPSVFLLAVQAPEAASEAPWVLYFHGNGERLGSPGSMGRYRLLREIGLNVLAVEYRGYGMAESAGAPSEEGLHRDALVAWRHLTQDRGVDAGRILIYGWSLGSGVAVRLASTVDPAGLVTEAAFTSVPDAARTLVPFLPVGLLMRNRFENLEKASAVTVPWLLFHGRGDRQVPFAHAGRLAARAAHPVVVPLDAGHDDGVTAAWTTASRALERFARTVF